MSALRRAVVAALALGLACGTSTGISGSGPGGNLGHLTGAVSIGPICPVEVEGDPCPVPAELYARVTVVVSDERGTRVQRFPLDDAGRYTVDLAEGLYRVTLEHDVGIPPNPAPVHTVGIAAGRTTVQDFDIDTGIR